MADTIPTPVPVAAAPSAAEVAAQVLTTVKDMQTRQEKLEKQLDDMSKKNSELHAKAPWARRGEDIMSSRGFQFSRVIGAALNKIAPDMCKIERELTTRLQKEYSERGLYTKHEANSILVPLGSELMHQSAPDDSTMRDLSTDIGEIVRAGVQGADAGEINYLRSKFAGGVNKGLSWQDEAGLGALVGPPVYGEPIQLLRNQEVFLKAGAQVIPFPPSGRAVWPRFTGATSAYMVGSGENSRTITGSSPTTSDVVMTAKKLGVLVTIPNELFRFPTVSVEQLLRADMMKSAALKMDSQFLDGPGGAVDVKGILKYTGINTFVAGTVGADGNTLEPEDIAKIIGTIEEQNLEFGAWIMRPLMYAAINNRRADATMPGDKKGMFLFNTLRTATERYVDVTNNTVGGLEGYNVFKTNQVSKTRSKGASSALTYILAGQFQMAMIALSGVMEFAIATQGDSQIFPQDQSQIRLITWVDMGVRYEEAFLKVDSLIVA